MTTSLRDRMKAKGSALPPQRYAVYADLLSRQDHPTVEQILATVNTDLPIASKASVYSALTVLREVGLVREVLLDEGVTRYDANVEPHHHFVCRTCGSIVDIDWQVLGQIDLSKLPQFVCPELRNYGEGDRCDACP